MRRNMCIEVRDLGLMPYAYAYALQTDLRDGIKEAKKAGETEFREHLLLVEHPPVITLGRHADPGNVLSTPGALRARGVETFRIERGGDVTYHGPGQLVVYPVLDMERHRLGVKKYVYLLEEAVIRTVAHWGIHGERVDGATGVWVDKGTPAERKICAIGVKCSRFVTMHGLALNVNTDLSAFSLINPCGFTDKGVTSVKRETGAEADMQVVKDTFVREFLNLLGAGNV